MRFSSSRRIAPLPGPHVGRVNSSDKQLNSKASEKNLLSLATRQNLSSGFLIVIFTSLMIYTCLGIWMRNIEEYESLQEAAKEAESSIVSRELSNEISVSNSVLSDFQAVIESNADAPKINSFKSVDDVNKPLNSLSKPLEQSGDSLTVPFNLKRIGVEEPLPKWLDVPYSQPIKTPVAEKWNRLGNLSEYECIGWRQTKGCTPEGDSEAGQDADCAANIEVGRSGYCEIRNRRTNKTERVLQLHCDSIREGVSLQCGKFQEYLEYGAKAPLYIHDENPKTFEMCKKTNKALQKTDKSSKDVNNANDGIAYVIHTGILESVYASVRLLRNNGCRLPIELWYIASETDLNHPVLRTLLSKESNNTSIEFREITDSRIKGFYTKLHAIYYSRFDRILLLDGDNYAVRDPAYLFNTKAFTTKGAIFWPDFWRPKKTIFNIHPRSFVWDLLELDFLDMFELESGQVIIDRCRHQKALNALMYYGTHEKPIEDLRVAWGDKDLFRFAWLKTDSAFHMIQMPPGSAGMKSTERDYFCGVALAQHDPDNNVIFLHRNQEKLGIANRRMTWTHIQQFAPTETNGVTIDDYDVRGANGGRYFPQFKRCFAKDYDYSPYFTLKPIQDFDFAEIELDLMRFISEIPI